MLETYTDVNVPDRWVRGLFREGLSELKNGGDRARAKRLFSMAAEEGCTEAMVNLGAIFAQGDQAEKEKAADLFKRAAEAEDPVGMRNIGYLYALGIGVPKDKKLAAEWYEKAAKRGNARAQCNLGVLYEFGNGVPQDYEKAAYWFMRSAEGGYSRGQTNIGVLLAMGKGIEKDPLAAAYWFTKSRSPRALYNLAMMYLKGEDIPSDTDEARRLLELSAANGYAKAMVALARMLEGTNDVRSKELYSAAALKGNEDAKRRLSELG